MELSDDCCCDRRGRFEIDPVFEINEAPLQTPRARDVLLLDLLGQGYKFRILLKFLLNGFNPVRDWCGQRQESTFHLPREGVCCPVLMTLLVFNAEVVPHEFEQPLLLCLSGYGLVP